MTNKRIMLRLTQTPTKIHYLMIEGTDRVVYNIQMQGSFAYGGRDDATILAKRHHACPSRRRMATASSPSCTVLVLSWRLVRVLSGGRAAGRLDTRRVPR